MNLHHNMLIEWNSNDGEIWVERILWIDTSNTNLFTIDIEFDIKKGVEKKKKQALPIPRQYTDIQTAFDSGNVRILEADPFSHLRLPDDLIPELHRKHRDNIWVELKGLIHGEVPSYQEKEGLDKIEKVKLETQLKSVENKHLRIFDTKLRGMLISELVERTGWAKKTIYSYLRRFWQRGQMPNALLPDYHACGGKGKERDVKDSKRGRPSLISKSEARQAGINVTPKVREIFRRGIKEFYNTAEKRPLSKVYELILFKYFNTGYEFKNGKSVPILPNSDKLPTWDQFRYWYEKENDQNKSILMREGNRKYNLSRRAITGDSTSMAFGPGTLIQGDATIGDLYLVSSLDRNRIIGRPVIYVLQDVFSRLIVGMTVNLEGPSWLGMMLALENSTMDKVAFCKEYGIDITEDEWPSHHLGEEYLGDRGELEGYNADQLVAGLNVRVSNTAPYRADWKGIVEQNFRLLNNEIIHWIPGSVTKPRERGDKDYRLNAILTLHEFRQLMIECVLKHNLYHRMDWYNFDEFAIRDHVPPYPIDLWNWGIQNRSGLLRDMSGSQDMIRLNLLPHDKASVTPAGIRFKGHMYTCLLAQNEHWFERARRQGRWELEVVFDPRKMDNIYLRLEQGRKLEPCLLLDKENTYKGKDWQEVIDYEALRSILAQKDRTRVLQAKAAYQTQFDQIIEEAKEKTEKARNEQSNRSRIQGIRSNRAEEKSLERENNSWDLNPNKTQIQSEQTSLDIQTEQDDLEDDRYVSPVDLSQILRKRREQAWQELQEKKKNKDE